ncbi:MAG: pyridoxamine 5'-phosphate oxidase family protein, partial [Pseudodonghicola sp.]
MIRLSDLDACFEGVIPSIIATSGADGAPNISYLSHVVRVDDDHIALSNQFFGKTAENLRRNPCATLLLVDGRSGAQIRVEAIFVRSEAAGPLFDLVAAQLAASSAQVGMESMMRLKAVDVFRVLSLGASPTLAAAGPEAAGNVELPRLAQAVETL